MGLGKHLLYRMSEKVGEQRFFIRTDLPDLRVWMYDRAGDIRFVCGGEAPGAILVADLSPWLHRQYDIGVSDLFHP